MATTTRIGVLKRLTIEADKHSKVTLIKFCNVVGNFWKKGKNNLNEKLYALITIPLTSSTTLMSKVKRLTIRPIGVFSK